MHWSNARIKTSRPMLCESSLYGHYSAIIVVAKNSSMGEARPHLASLAFRPILGEAQY